MDTHVIYSKTVKGLKTANAWFSGLSSQARQVLTLVDGRLSVADILAQTDKLTEDKLAQLLVKLEGEGYIRQVASHATVDDWSANSSSVSGISVEILDDEGDGETLDFTGYTAEPQADFNAAEAANAQAQATEVARQAAEQARLKAEAEHQAKAAAKEQARLEAERERAKAEKAARLQAEAKARAEAEEKARIEAGRLAREAAEREAREAAAAKARAEEEARQAEAEEARRNAERIEREKAEAAARIKAEAEALAKAEAEEQARLEAERFARDEAERHAREIAEAQARVEEEAQQQAEAKRKIQAEAEEKVRIEAERIAREEAEQEARLAAEHKAREEAEEQARLKAERLAQKEAERRAHEEEKARLEAEKQAQREAEKAAREETRRIAREEKEEKSRRKAEEKSQAKAIHSVEAPGKRVFKAVTTILILAPLTILVLVGLLQFVNLGMLAQPVEKLASDSFGEPVTVRDVHAMLFPQPHLVLGGVVIGNNAAAIKVDAVHVSPVISTIFERTKTLGLLEIESLVLAPADFDRAVQWVNAAAGSGKLRIVRIEFKRVTFSIPGLASPPFDGRVGLTPAGRLNHVELGSADKSLTIKLTPQAGSCGVELMAGGWQLPLGGRLTFETLAAKGVVGPDQAIFSQIEGRVYGGEFKAHGTVGWRRSLSASGGFELSGVDLSRALSDSGSSASVDGRLNAVATFSSQADGAAKLAEAPEIRASFDVLDGKVGGIDLAHALLAGDSQSQAGGTTRFDKLSGIFQLKNGYFKYSQLTLQSARILAHGNLDIQPDQAVSGKLNAELMAKSRHLQADFSVAGKVGKVKIQ